MKTKLLQIPITKDIDDALLQISKREKRSKSAQASLMLERALSHYFSENTQVSMPTTDEEREAMLERMR